MRLTKEEFFNLIQKRPHLKPDENHNHKNPRTPPKLEPDPGNAPLGQKELQGATETAIVRIVSVRKNLLDEDNICEKYLVDILRYAHLINDDNPEQTTIQTSQRKCKAGEQEHTEITIEIK